MFLCHLLGSSTRSCLGRLLNAPFPLSSLCCLKIEQFCRFLSYVPYDLFTSCDVMMGFIWQLQFHFPCFGFICTIPSCLFSGFLLDKRTMLTSRRKGIFLKKKLGCCCISRFTCMNKPFSSLLFHSWHLWTRSLTLKRGKYIAIYKYYSICKSNF